MYFALIIWTSVSGPYHVSTHFCQKIYSLVLGKIGVSVFNEQNIRKVHGSGCGLRELSLAYAGYTLLCCVYLFLISNQAEAVFTDNVPQTTAIVI